jgi:hypothetical protein
MSGGSEGPFAGAGRADRGPRGDETELFLEYDRPLRRRVQGLVNTSPDIVDDACSFAWMEFMR